MSPRARFYIGAILVLAAMACGVVVATGTPAPAAEWSTLGIFIALATFAQLYSARAPGHQSYHMTLALHMAGVILLQPFSFVLLIAVPHVIEWIKERWVKSARLRNWYLQPFNIATHIFSGFAARVVFIHLNPNLSALTTLSTPVAVLLATCAYVLLNHLLVGMAITLARSVSWRQSGVLEFENLLRDAVLLLMGAGLAIFWTLNPWLSFLALSPLVLMYQALKIPQLQRDASIDEKTGLYNARHFALVFTAEMERAKRFNRPLSVLMADLDLLRNINNTYGHLAGDAVLGGVGQIIRSTVREYDVPARFGGEEFVVALPETEMPEARAIAERIRLTIEQASFEAKAKGVQLHATISIGIACFPTDAAARNELIHQADIAVYQAKLKGRNRVVYVGELPASVRNENLPTEDRLDAPFIANPGPGASPFSSTPHQPPPKRH